MPNERSSHSQPTPRGGGLAPAIAIAVALVAAGSVDSRTQVALLIAIGAFGLIGLVEDLAGVPVLWRFVLQLAAAAAVAPWLLSDLGGQRTVALIGGAIALLFVVAYVNAFNFMDGINGIAVAQTLVAGATWYVVGQVEHVASFATAGAVAAAAALAFAPFNFPRARVFLGDVGSYALGAALAVLAVVGLRAGIAPEAVLAPLSLYVADTGATLVRRLRRGEPWYRPHRDHVYQQLVRSGWSHTTTTLVVGAVMLVTAALGAVSLGTGIGERVAADAGILVVLAGYLMAPRLARSRRQEAAVA